MFKNIKTWVQSKVDQFETWSASWLPGMKTKLIAGIGTVGMLAAVSQEYITGLPLDQFISAPKLAMTNAVLFTLAYWTKRLSDKE